MVIVSSTSALVGLIFMVFFLLLLSSRITQGRAYESNG